MTSDALELITAEAASLLFDIAEDEGVCDDSFAILEEDAELQNDETGLDYC